MGLEFWQAEQTHSSHDSGRDRNFAHPPLDFWTSA
jgi:hypothetical protein